MIFNCNLLHAFSMVINKGMVFQTVIVKIKLYSEKTLKLMMMFLFLPFLRQIWFFSVPCCCRSSSVLQRENDEWLHLGITICIQWSSFTMFPCILVLSFSGRWIWYYMKPSLVKGDVLCKSNYCFLLPHLLPPQMSSGSCV